MEVEQEDESREEQVRSTERDKREKRSGTPSAVADGSGRVASALRRQYGSSVSEWQPGHSVPKWRGGAGTRSPEWLHAGWYLSCCYMGLDGNGSKSGRGYASWWRRSWQHRG